MTRILFCIDLKPGGCPGTAQPCKLRAACIVPGGQGSTVKPRWVSGWNVDDMSLTPNQQELFECLVPCLLHRFMHKQQWETEDGCALPLIELPDCNIRMSLRMSSSSSSSLSSLTKQHRITLVLLSVPWVKKLTEQGWKLTDLWACMLRHEGRGSLSRPRKVWTCGKFFFCSGTY